MATPHAVLALLFCALLLGSAAPIARADDAIACEISERLEIFNDAFEDHLDAKGLDREPLLACDVRAWRNLNAEGASFSESDWSFIEKVALVPVPEPRTAGLTAAIGAIIALGASRRTTPR